MWTGSCPDTCKLRSRIGLWHFTEEKLETYVYFFLPLSIVAFALGLLQAMRSRRRQLLAVAALCMAGGLWLESWRPMPHYASPATAMVLVFVLGGYRWLRSWKVGGCRAGLGLTRALAVVLVLITCNNLPSEAIQAVSIYPDQEPQFLMRARIQTQLEHAQGKHLVMVRYSPGHYYEWEWVYNRADLNAARVVWARSMDPETDAELIRHFPGRQVWLVEPDRPWLNLSAYHLADADQVLCGPCGWKRGIRTRGTGHFRGAALVRFRGNPQG